MNTRTPCPAQLLACLALALPAPALAGAPETPQAETAPEAPLWSGTVELYGFAPLRSTGSVTIRGQEAEVDQDLGEILSVLRFAASARGSIEKGRVGLQGDLWYINLGDQASRLVGQRNLFTTTADVGQTLGIYDLALRYRFGERESAIGKPGSYSVIPYAGVRLIDGRLSLAAALDGPFGRTLLEPTRSLQRTWVQPLVGTQASVFLSPRLRAFARGDIGGFGLAGQQDLSGNAQVGLGYAIGDNTDLNISWRYMGLKWNNGEAQSNGFVSNLNGIEIGVKVFFGGAPRGTAVATTPVTEPTPTAP
ncbi:hypothetical protein VB738_09425 [Cyanobium gracile UHCC 0139]|uniref:Outer membrane protein beta-barrel domain-containing protein n=1 Tax=Cyanobium gracile UHCC 0139 TaxID=3110308 RepID=A0ABU5RUN9_9CYAN|nr:hypothetical protein [Cyanobium gracile]MEA5391479.1 hypothetical protein [Cyanobium gracile UHCC 0139]